MKIIQAIFPCIALLLASSAFAAPELPLPPPLPPDLVALKPLALLPTTAAEFEFYDNTKNPTPAAFTELPEDGPGLAYRVEVPLRGKNSYDIEAKLKSAAVKKGDIVLARFMARAPIAKQESGEGSVGFAFQRRVAPWEKSIGITVTPGPEWALYEVAFTVAHDFAPGEAGVALSFANLAQTVEISGLELLDFQNRATLDQLPKITFTYKGREADAAWRKAALKRIEEIRTAPLTIHITDTAGKPIPDARVQASLAQAEFIWGTSVDDKVIVADSPEGEIYRKTLLEFFNTAVIENGLKWPTWNGGKNRQAIALQALDWIANNGLRHKGHNLVWPGLKFSPKIVKELADPAKELPPLIEAHIAEMVPVTKGRSYGWDVVNEPIHERDYFKYIPDSSIADWFKQAHALDPDLQLFINEYAMLNNAISPGMIARFRDLIGQLRAAGAPIHGIGIQGHIGAQPRSPADCLADLDLLAAEGLPLQITEFDVNSTDEAMQAEYTRDFLIACYSHPSITGFIMWGFSQSHHWKPDAAMFRKDWSEKPNAAVWREWVLGKWKTHFDGLTSAEGSATTRGHFGKYQITVTHNGVVKEQDVTLTHSGAEIVIKIP